MFCSQCGARATGNFCAACGARLVPPQLGPVGPPDAFPAHVDWRHESRYEVLLRFAEVRDRIARSAATAKAGLTGERFLELCDAAFAPIPGVSLSAVAGIACTIYSRLGVQTGKSQDARLATPVGSTLVATLCSLARHGRTLKEVHQAADGCVLEATIPSDIWSFAGELVVTIERDDPGTRVEAATRIPGQLYDWGKSAKCLAQLFDDVQSRAA